MSSTVGFWFFKAQGAFDCILPAICFKLSNFIIHFFDAGAGAELGDAVVVAVVEDIERAHALI